MGEKKKQRRELTDPSGKLTLVLTTIVYAMLLISLLALGGLIIAIVNKSHSWILVSTTTGLASSALWTFGIFLKAYINIRLYEEKTKRKILKITVRRYMAHLRRCKEPEKHHHGQPELFLEKLIARLDVTI